jgi:hypothetical protein
MMLDNQRVAPAGTIENAAMRSSMRLMTSSWPRIRNMPELVRMLRTAEHSAARE